MKNAESEKQQREKQRKQMIRDYAIFIVVAIGTAAIFSIFPVEGGRGTQVIWDYFVEMMEILPAVVVLMGLFQVWISRELVIKYLGGKSGLKGIGLSIFFGTLPAGPLYIAFPLAAMLLQKGARISNVVIFLSAFACIKSAQELVELQFLGASFMLARLLLTIPMIIIVGFFVEWLSDSKAGIEVAKEVKI